MKLVLKNRYIVNQEIGHGGMGQVYVAWDQELSRRVAVKLIRDWQDEALRSRFSREARTLALINHPNIINIYDFGEEGGRPYIIMEYVEGRTLGELIKCQAPYSFPAGFNWIIKILHGLEAIHEQGIIHRDIKPQNIIITENNEVKIVDFGIVRLNSAQELTMTGVTLGTIQYMAPEQILGGLVTPATDLYALGVILYEMYTGRTPFIGDNVASLALKQVGEEPLSLGEFNPRIDKELDIIILKFLQKRSEDRFISSQQALRAFRRYVAPGETRQGFHQFRSKRNQGTQLLPRDRIPRSNSSKYLTLKLKKLKYKLYCFIKSTTKKLVALGLIALALFYGANAATSWLKNKAENMVRKSFTQGFSRLIPTPSKIKEGLEPEVIDKDLEILKDDLEALGKVFKEQEAQKAIQGIRKLEEKFAVIKNNNLLRNKKQWFNFAEENFNELKEDLSPKGKFSKKYRYNLPQK